MSAEGRYAALGASAFGIGSCDDWCLAALIARGSGVLDPNCGYRGQQAQHLENLGIEDKYIMRLRNQARVAAGV